MNPRVSLVLAPFCLGLATFCCLSHSLPAEADDAPPAPYTGLPYHEKPASLPGVIQAEEYDIAPNAANGISFNYNGGGKQSDLRRTPDSIGLGRFGQGHVKTTGEAEDPNQVYVGWTQEGEWLKYTVHVAQEGTYRLGGQYSSAGKNSVISVSFSSPTLKAPITTGLVAIPTTAGYQPNVEVYHVWETLDNLASVTLPQGDLVMTVKIEKDDGLNLDYFSITPLPPVKMP